MSRFPRPLVRRCSLLPPGPPEHPCPGPAQKLVTRGVRRESRSAHHPPAPRQRLLDPALGEGAPWASLGSEGTGWGPWGGSELRSALLVPQCQRSWSAALPVRPNAWHLLRACPPGPLPEPLAVGTVVLLHLLIPRKTGPLSSTALIPPPQSQAYTDKWEAQDPPQRAPTLCKHRSWWEVLEALLRQEWRKRGGPGGSRRSAPLPPRLPRISSL